MASTRIEDFLKRGVVHKTLKDPLEEVEKLKAELVMLTEAVGEALSALPAPQVVEVAKDPVQGPTGPQGASGKDGESLVWRGTWEEKQTYNKNDVVNYLGSSYIATKTTTKDYPNRINNGWDLLAASGASGARGPQGEAGPTIGAPTFIQPTQPDHEGSYVWIQTGLGESGCDYTVWYNICEE